MDAVQKKESRTIGSSTESMIPHFSVEAVSAFQVKTAWS
jgi:hypothetical protein